jgi:hypothetical protein
MEIAHGRFRVETLGFLWEYHALGEYCISLLGGLFVKLWEDLDDLNTARSIFVRVCSNLETDMEIKETGKKLEEIQTGIGYIRDFISLKSPLGMGVVARLQIILENEDEAEECAKFLMGKVLTMLLERIYNITDK